MFVVLDAQGFVIGMGHHRSQAWEEPMENGDDPQEVRRNTWRATPALVDAARLHGPVAARLQPSPSDIGGMVADVMPG